MIQKPQRKYINRKEEESRGCIGRNAHWLVFRLVKFATTTSQTFSALLLA